MLIYMLAYLDGIDEEEKFIALYRVHFVYMRSIAFDILSDDMLAEDAVQNAFIKVMPRLDAIGDVESKTTRVYLGTVARNSAINIYNKRKGQWLRDGAVSEETQGYSEDETALTDKLTVDMILEKLSRLSDDYVDILVYRYYYDMTSKEIAAVLGIKDSLVRKRLQRGKELLQAIIEEEGE